MQQRKIKRYGWKPDLPDQRDYSASEFLSAVEPVVKTVELIGHYNMPPIYDQGQLGSCTANALARLVEFDLMNKSATADPTAKLFMPSRLFIYYFERYIEGTVSTDSGAQIRDGIKVLNTKGVCTENIWPYNVSEFAEEPSAAAIAEAINFTALKYYRVNSSNKANIIQALLGGHPVAYGFAVYDSFESSEVASTGIVPMPASGESVIGGHAVVTVGYDETTDQFLCANSWNTDWGINGYFKIPAAYLTNSDLASDFWIIETIK
jgi:C1A family cysteine protease